MEVGPVTSQVFLAIVEVAPTARCTLVADDAIGALAWNFVVEKSEAVAIVRIVDALRFGGFDIVKLVWSGTVTSPEAQARKAFDVVDVSARARRSKSVHLHLLETWTHEDVAKRTG